MIKRNSRGLIVVALALVWLAAAWSWSSAETLVMTQEIDGTQQEVTFFLSVLGSSLETADAALSDNTGQWLFITGGTLCLTARVTGPGRVMLVMVAVAPKVTIFDGIWEEYIKAWPEVVPLMIRPASGGRQ